MDCSSVFPLFSAVLRCRCAPLQLVPVSCSPQSDTGSLSGWLRKPGKKAVSTSRRWVVLDGTSLMYYKDQTEANLKGVLYLYGCKCCPIKKSKLEMRKGRDFEFEVVASDKKPAPGTAVAVSGSATGSSAASSHAASTPRRTTSLFSFGKPAHDVNDSVNPLKVNKKTYRWFASSAEERDKWMAAIARAAGMPQAERDAMQWATQFMGAKSTAQYAAVLQALIMSGQ